MKIFKYEFETKQKNGLKALIVSDIHILTNKDNYKLLKIIKQVKSMKYDTIFIAGDLLDSTNILKNSYTTNNLIQNLNLMSNYSSIYYCLGNHDLCEFDYKNSKKWTPNIQEIQKNFLNILDKNPRIHITSNKVYKIKEGFTVSIINPSLDYVLNNADGDESVLLKELPNYSCFNNLNKNDDNICLCHYPNALITMYEKGYLKNIKLSISGHNHNGLTQLKLPIEALLNLFKQKNRGFITPNLSLSPKKTKFLRGKVQLDEFSSLIINPAFTSLSHTSGVLNNFDFLFYQGITEIEFIPKH